VLITSIVLVTPPEPTGTEPKFEVDWVDVRLEGRPAAFAAEVGGDDNAGFGVSVQLSGKGRRVVRAEVDLDRAGFTGDR
jgi:hypothetical protein